MKYNMSQQYYKEVTIYSQSSNLGDPSSKASPKFETRRFFNRSNISICLFLLSSASSSLRNSSAYELSRCPGFLHFLIAFSLLIKLASTDFLLFSLRSFFSFSINSGFKSADKDGSGSASTCNSSEI